MAITVNKYVPRIKAELRILSAADDARIALLIKEAVDSLQTYKTATLVDYDAIPGECEAALTTLDLRYVAAYVALQYTMNVDFNTALDMVLLAVRTK